MTRGMTMGEVVRLLDLCETLPLGNGMFVQKAGEWRLSEAQIRELTKDEEFPCATCDRWSRDCCGPWETPEEHGRD